MRDDFQGQVQLQITLANDRPTEQFRGFDWFHLTREEELVFAIDPAHFPRMITVWAAYELFMELVSEGSFTCAPEIVKAERNRRADIVEMGVSINGFQQFAKEYTGMPFREAHAMFCKHQFWLVRNGISEYSDERERKPPHE